MISNSSTLESQCIRLRSKDGEISNEIKLKTIRKSYENYTTVNNKLRETNLTPPL